MRDSESMVNPDAQIANAESMFFTLIAVKNLTRTRIASNNRLSGPKKVQTN